MVWDAAQASVSLKCPLDDSNVPPGLRPAGLVDRLILKVIVKSSFEPRGHLAMSRDIFIIRTGTTRRSQGCYKAF